MITIFFSSHSTRGRKKAFGWIYVDWRGYLIRKHWITDFLLTECYWFYFHENHRIFIPKNCYLDVGLFSFNTIHIQLGILVLVHVHSFCCSVVFWHDKTVQQTVSLPTTHPNITVKCTSAYKRLYFEINDRKSQHAIWLAWHWVSNKRFMCLLEHIGILPRRASPNQRPDKSNVPL